MGVAWRAQPRAGPGGLGVCSVRWAEGVTAVEFLRGVFTFHFQAQG